MDLLASAETELADIERKLAELAPLATRRDQLRMFLNIGRTLYAPPSGQTSILNGEPQARPPAAALVRSDAKPARTDTLKARIADAVESIIHAEGPMRTRELLKRIEARGIEIGGANKLDSVSVVLSRSKDRFKVDRAAGGWVIVHPHKEVTPSGAPTPAGS